MGKPARRTTGGSTQRLSSPSDEDDVLSSSPHRPQSRAQPVAGHLPSVVSIDAPLSSRRTKPTVTRRAGSHQQAAASAGGSQAAVSVSGDKAVQRLADSKPARARQIPSDDDDASHGRAKRSRSSSTIATRQTAQDGQAHLPPRPRPQPCQVRLLQPPINIPDHRRPTITDATHRVTARGSVPTYGPMWMPSPHGVAMQMPMQPSMMMQMPSQQGLAMHTHPMPQYLYPHGHENAVAGSGRHTTESYVDNSGDRWMGGSVDQFADYPWYDQGHE